MKILLTLIVVLLNIILIFDLKFRPRFDIITTESHKSLVVWYTVVDTFKMVEHREHIKILTIKR